MTQNETEAGASVVFHPQEWVDSPGDTHHRDKKQLIPSRERDPVTYTVPKPDATGDDGTVFADESYRANLLQTHPAAPAWVSEWDGPYYIRTGEQ